MNRVFASISAAALLALAAGCEEAPPSEGIETTILAIETPQGNRVEVNVPVDLSGVEKAMSALSTNGLGGTNVFNVEMMATTGFQTTIEGAMGSFFVGSGISNSFGAVAPISPAFSATAGCDLSAAVCQFGTVACQYLPQLVAKFGSELGDDDVTSVSQSQCIAAACGAANELLDLEEFPAGLKCAAAGMLSCISGQLPSVVNALMSIQVGGDNSGAKAMLEDVGLQLVSCLGPYATGLGSVVEIGQTTDMPYDESSDW